MVNIKNDKRLSWFYSGQMVRPYVYIRKESLSTIDERSTIPDWFRQQPIFKNPLEAGQVDFANTIYRLEGKAFGKVNMAMPRWVFYDCAILPGFVAGFAARRDQLSPKVREALEVDEQSEEPWVALSLFICIPTMVGKGEWVAHNLCSVNTLLDRNESFYGLGFLTKAFGLWFANVKSCIGITQWGSPALHLHSHYGDFEILTAYTPVHTYPNTLTYRLKVDPSHWDHFFNKGKEGDFLERYRPTGFEVHPKDEESMKSFQHRLEDGEGPFFLNPDEIRKQALDHSIRVYRPIALN